MNLPKHPKKTDPFSVLVIAEEDMIDLHVSGALSTFNDITIAAHHASSISAISEFRKNYFDVIILDIGMSDEDGLITIRRLVRIDPNAKIIMASTLSFTNVRKSMAGFEIGAAEFIQPPSNITSKISTRQFAADLSRMVRGLGQARRLEKQIRKPITPIVPQAPSQDLKLRRPSTERPKILAIGSSTGGPSAVTALLTALPFDFPLPIVITQHMPATFTSVFATTLGNRSGKPSCEGENGMILKPNHVYVAPGDFHMTLKGQPGNVKIALDQNPPVNHCRPSVDPMVNSIVGIFGANTLLIILTGMGSDGLTGARCVAENNGTVIAQDFETSVVWGMPRAVAEAGLCSEVLPLDKIAGAITKLVQ